MYHPLPPHSLFIMCTESRCINRLTTKVYTIEVTKLCTSALAVILCRFMTHSLARSQLSGQPTTVHPDCENHARNGAHTMLEECLLSPIVSMRRETGYPVQTRAFQSPSPDMAMPSTAPLPPPTPDWASVHLLISKFMQLHKVHTCT